MCSRGTADDSLWPMIQKKLEVLNRAGLSKDNFEDSDQRDMEMEKQKTIDDFYSKKARTLLLIFPMGSSHPIFRCYRCHVDNSPPPPGGLS